MEGDLYTVGLQVQSGLGEGSVTVGTGASSTVGWGGYFNTDTLAWMTRDGLPLFSEGSPLTNPDPTVFCPVARQYQVQLHVTPLGSATYRAQLSFYDASMDETHSFMASNGGANSDPVIITGPWMSSVSPISLDGSWTSNIFNDSGSSIDFKARLFMHFKI
jgi:hypothetical protein